MAFSWSHVTVTPSTRRVRELWPCRDGVDRHRDVYFETFFMAGILSSQSYLQMKTLSAALEQSEEIMQWINASSCVVQRVLQFGVCWGLREVLLSRRSCPSFDFHTGH